MFDPCSCHFCVHFAGQTWVYCVAACKCLQSENASLPRASIGTRNHCEASEFRPPSCRTILTRSEVNEFEQTKWTVLQILLFGSFQWGAVTGKISCCSRGWCSETDEFCVRKRRFRLFLHGCVLQRFSDWGFAWFTRSLQCCMYLKRCPFHLALGTPNARLKAGGVLLDWQWKKLKAGRTDHEMHWTFCVDVHKAYSFLTLWIYQDKTHQKGKLEVVLFSDHPLDNTKPVLHFFFTNGFWGLLMFAFSITSQGDSQHCRKHWSLTFSSNWTAFGNGFDLPVPASLWLKLAVLQGKKWGAPLRYAQSCLTSKGSKCRDHTTPITSNHQSSIFKNITLYYV